MDIRMGPELGLKNPMSFRPLGKGEPPVIKEAGIPGNPIENRQFREQKLSETAIRPDQAKPVFQIKGSVIDVKA